METPAPLRVYSLKWSKICHASSTQRDFVLWVGFLDFLVYSYFTV